LAGPCSKCGGSGSAFNPCSQCGAGKGDLAAPKGVQPEAGAIVGKGETAPDENAPESGE
jgi:DnaJ-class molecular chaperone